MIEEVSSYLNQVRHDFSKSKLDEASVEKTPIKQYAKWFEEAVGAQSLDPKAIVVSTVNNAGCPSSRVVYNRGLKANGIVFYTNYNSIKGGDLELNQNASILSYWPELERQVRMQGVVTKLDSEESDAYFASRPRESQIAAASFVQSKIIPGRKTLEQNFVIAEDEYQYHDIPCPENWGGYRLIPNYFEFWQGRENRLHDRFMFALNNQNLWDIERLSP